MDFSSLIKKNIKHNIRNYTAFLFGNIIIQSISELIFIKIDIYSIIIIRSYI